MKEGSKSYQPNQKRGIQNRLRFGHLVKFEEKGLAENFSELPLCMRVAQRQSRINEGVFEVYQTYISSFSAQLPNVFNTKM